MLDMTYTVAENLPLGHIISSCEKTHRREPCRRKSEQGLFYGDLLISTLQGEGLTSPEEKAPGPAFSTDGSPGISVHLGGSTGEQGHSHGGTVPLHHLLP